jgi:hypothetical protein
MKKQSGKTSPATFKQPKIAAEPDHSESCIDPQQRHAEIAKFAYYRAEERGFAPGHDIKDWTAAEIDFDDMLRK